MCVNVSLETLKIIEESVWMGECGTECSGRGGKRYIRISQSNSVRLDMQTWWQQQKLDIINQNYLYLHVKIEL